MPRKNKTIGIAFNHDVAQLWDTKKDKLLLEMPKAQAMTIAQAIIIKYREKDGTN